VARGGRLAAALRGLLSELEAKRPVKELIDSALIAESNLPVIPLTDLKAAEQPKYGPVATQQFLQTWKLVKDAAKGWDETSRSAGHMIQENVARMMSCGKTVSEAKSMTDMMSMQQDFLKDCVDLWMAGASKLSEISARTAKDVVEPVAQCANSAISSMMSKARAA